MDAHELHRPMFPFVSLMELSGPFFMKKKNNKSFFQSLSCIAFKFFFLLGERGSYYLHFNFFSQDNYKLPYPMLACSLLIKNKQTNLQTLSW